MARIQSAPGACPVCALPAPRAIHAEPAREVYRCPAHGRLEYGPATVPLAALGAALLAAPVEPTGLFG